MVFISLDGSMHTTGVEPFGSSGKHLPATQQQIMTHLRVGAHTSKRASSQTLQFSDAANATASSRLQVTIVNAFRFLLTTISLLLACLNFKRLTIILGALLLWRAEHGNVR